MQNLTLTQKVSLVIAIAICIIAPTFGYLKIGLAPVIIVGGSAIIGFFFWYFTYLKKPNDPKIILPIFILAVAGLQFTWWKNTLQALALLFQEYLMFHGLKKDS